MTTKNNVDRAATFISDAIEDIESGRDLGALSFLREAMFLLLSAPSEMTPIPAVASAERERLIAEIDRAIADSFRVTRAFGRDVITEYFDGEFGCHAEAAYDYMAPQIESLSSQLNEAREALQRAQADRSSSTPDALDARRYQLLRQLIDEDETFQVTEWLDNSTEELFITATDLDRRLDALRTSSPDPVVPRGEDGEKGK